MLFHKFLTPKQPLSNVVSSDLSGQITGPILFVRGCLLTSCSNELDHIRDLKERSAFLLPQAAIHGHFLSMS